MKLTDKDINNQNTERLLEEYRGFVKAKAHLYYMLGGDREDIIQEGMIGLYKAIQTFDASKGASFKSYADLCISRQIINAIKMANRKKYAPLNDALSMDDQTGEDMLPLQETIAGGIDGDPEIHALLNEMAELLLSEDGKYLSSAEKEVLKKLLQGMQYKDIAAAMGKSPKQIDNTIQRIRTKIKKLFAEE